MAKTFYTVYRYDDRKYYTYSSEIDANALPPNNSTRTPVPVGPWDDQWPKWVDPQWVMEQDFYGVEYWPAGSTWEDYPRFWDKHGALPEGATTTRPPDPNGPRKDAINQRLFAIQMEINDLKKDREDLYAKVFLDKATAEDKADLQVIIDKENALNTERDALIKEYNELL